MNVKNQVNNILSQHDAYIWPDIYLEIPIYVVLFKYLLLQPDLAYIWPEFFQQILGSCIQ